MSNSNVIRELNAVIDELRAALAKAEGRPLRAADQLVRLGAEVDSLRHALREVAKPRRFSVSLASKRMPTAESPWPGAVAGDADEDGESVWYVEIRSLDELLAITEEHGAVIHNEEDGEPGSIVIYDDFL